MLVFPSAVADRGRLRASSGPHLREQGFLDDHQVGEGEQGMQLRGVLGQPAVAQLPVTEQSAPALVFRLRRLARRRAAVASCVLLAGAADAGRGAGRPGSPQEGLAGPRRDHRESGGAARGRSLWTHRGERLPDATTPPQAATGECRLMHLRLHANATTTPRTRAYIQKSQASNAALARELGIHNRTVARWRARQDVAIARPAHIASTPA